MFTAKHYGKILFGVCSSVIFIGIVSLGSRYYHLPKPTIQNTVIEKEEEEEDEKEIYIEKHHQRFLKSYHSHIDYNENIQKEFYLKEEYDNLIVQPNNILESSWKRRILIEPTPFGNIIMFYNSYKQGFSYYCDVNIPYPILNSVAMKYVLKYFCRDFFIDNSIVPMTASSPFLHIHEIEKRKAKNKKIDVANGPFAKLKTYKPEPKKTIGKDGTKQTEEKTEDFIKNKFIGCGKIYHFSPLQHVSQKTVKKDIPIKYSSFKQWHNPERFELIP